MPERFAQAWCQLQGEPSLWLGATLLAYAAGIWLYRKSGYMTVLQPVVTAIVLLAATLIATGTDYGDYMKGGHLISFLFGPAVVAMAVPLYEQRMRIARHWAAIACGLTAGAVTSVVSAVLIARALGASPETLASIAPKSVTVPIAMGISREIGGIPDLTAVIVVLTGIFGALACRPLFALMREDDHVRQGLAIGLAAHGVGTGAAFQIDRETGAFAGLAMGLTGLISAFLIPALLPFLTGTS